MSTASEIWEVMADEISAHPHDRLEMFRGRALEVAGASVSYSSASTEAAVIAAEIDPDDATGDARTLLAEACKHYDVTAREVRNSRIRRTAVVAARFSLVITLHVAGWRDGEIADFLHMDRPGVVWARRGGRGTGVRASSRIAKDFVARRVNCVRPSPPLPHTLEEARVAEARGEGTVRFVNGVPQWTPNSRRAI